MLQAKKALGQHFLTDSAYCWRMVRLAEVSVEDTVLEIGPGTGRLTEVLLRTAGRVIAVEFDDDMVRRLQERWLSSQDPAVTRLELFQADILRFDWDRILSRGPIKVLGNLPYNISTRILTRLADLGRRLQSVTVMVQKEVADRILAGPRTRDFGYFTLVMEYHFERAAGFQVPPGAFSPRPKVTSFVLKLTPRDTNPSVADYGRFRSILKQAFLHRRKTLWKNLKAQGYSEGVLESAWREIGIAPQARPEEVSLSEYVRLTGVL